MNSPTILDELDVRMKIAQVFQRDHEQAYGNIMQAHKNALENGHRFLLLLTAILALAIPGAAASSMVHSGWLRWGAAWFGVSMALEVIVLRVSHYLVMWSLLKWNEYTKTIMEIIANSSIDDDALIEAFQAIGKRTAGLQVWGKRNLKMNAALGAFSDLLVYGTFLLGVYCLCRSLLASP